jgi:hypothetical protein
MVFIHSDFTHNTLIVVIDLMADGSFLGAPPTWLSSLDLQMLSLLTFQKPKLQS